MKLSVKTALIVSVLSIALSAHANSETQTQANVETTAQTGEVVEMVGVRNYNRHDGGGSGGYVTSIGVGVVSNTGGYILGKVVTQDEITKEGLIASMATGIATGHVSAPVHGLKKATEIAVVNIASGTLISDVDKRASNKSNDNDNDNDDKTKKQEVLWQWEREFHR